MWNLSKSVSHLRTNHAPASTGHCARYVREAIESGGLSLAHTLSAKDYGKSLVDAGFLPTSDQSHRSGDVVVIQNIDGHPHGHMAMFDGKQWISDFAQRDMYPGAAYRLTKPAYQIYRNPKPQSNNVLTEKRGIRNNNPGNIKHSYAAWLGKSDVHADNTFVTFDTPEHGIRAMAVILKNYQVKHNLHSTQQMISRWAPKNADDNKTDAYVKNVANHVGVDPNANIDLVGDIHKLARFIEGMIRQENGEVPYAFDTLVRGASMASHSASNHHHDRSSLHVHSNNHTSGVHK